MGVVRAVCLAGYLLFNAYIRVHIHRECKLKWGCLSARLAVIDCLRWNARQEGGTQHAHCQWEYNPSGSTTLQTHLEVFSYVEQRRQWHPTPVPCLENPMGGGSWWAAVYGVAQSRIQLKQLSSSSYVEIAYTPDPTISFLNTHPTHVHKMFKYVYSVPYWLKWSRI